MWPVSGAFKTEKLHCFEPSEVYLEGRDSIQRGGNTNSPVATEQKWKQRVLVS